MSRETIKVQIGECEYSLTHLKAREQRIVMRRIVAAAAPFASVQDDGGMARAIAEVLKGLSDEDLDKITECFAEVTHVVTPLSGGVALPLSAMIEDHFAGKGMSAWAQWMRASIDHNFSGFFTELRSLASGLGVARPDPKSPSQST